MKKLFAFLSSMKLALVLFLLIIVLSVLATLVPQNRPPEFYREEFSSSVSGLILALHFHRFFKSALFLVPAGAFFVNLFSCSVRRMVRRARRGAKKRYGPDVIHFAVLLLIVIGVLSIFVTGEAQVTLTRGESFELPNTYTVRVNELHQIEYEDGRPKDWLTEVSVTKGGETYLDEYTIEVNRPLRLGSYKAYQHTFGIDADIILKTGEDTRGTVKPGEGFTLGGRSVFVDSVSAPPDGEPAAVFLTREGGETVRFVLEEGATENGFTVEEIVSYPRTGLLIRYNPLFPVILALLLVFVAGLGLSFIQKIGDRQL
jgi:cytochrome c biogenesis protein ResB